jgi:hypothetical protein
MNVSLKFAIATSPYKTQRAVLHEVNKRLQGAGHRVVSESESSGIIQKDLLPSPPVRDAFAAVLGQPAPQLFPSLVEKIVANHNVTKRAQPTITRADFASVSKVFQTLASSPDATDQDRNYYAKFLLHLSHGLGLDVVKFAK